jgi:L-lactate dehydrogenase complex protein LldG
VLDRLKACPTGWRVSRDTILHRIRTALGRRAGEPPEPPPPVLLQIPEITVDRRVEMFAEALGALTGKTTQVASTVEACERVADLVRGKHAVASRSPLLAECGITALPEVQSVFGSPEALRAELEIADFGITGAEYALADTGTLVMVSSPEEARMISLLPPTHIAVIRRERILTGLDELFTLLPLPAERSSAIALITGPSRTADIEMLLVRGVHGPGAIHVMVI